MAKTVLLAGASGLVGSNILVELKKTNARLISLARTKLCANDGIEEIICDFDHVDKLESEIIFDEVYIAIGSKLELYELLYLKKSRRDDFKKIDLEFIKNVAFFAKKNGAKSIGLVSAVGANHKSSNAYLNIKGKTEREIISLGFKKTIIAQPSHLLGDRQKEKIKLSIYLFEKITNLFGFLMIGPLSKFRNISATNVAKALVTKVNESSEGTHYLNFKNFKLY